MDKYVIGHLILGPGALIMGYLFKRFPPQKINGLYGYRTPRSMRSKGAWDEGNRFSANSMILAAAFTCLVQLVTSILLSHSVSFQLSAATLVAGLIGGVILTELHLKKKGF